MSKPVDRFLSMPLDFERNQGQAPSGYAFVAHGPSYALGISAKALTLSLHGSAAIEGSANQQENPITPASEAVGQLELRLADANPNAAVAGIDEQPGSSNYFIGRDQSQWRRSIPHFNRVKIAGAYPGIDVVFYGNREQLGYDFTVAPDGDPKAIRLLEVGAQSVRLDEAGNAVLTTDAGDVTLLRPVAYQQANGARVPVASKFRLVRGKMLTIAVGKYDHRQKLIIDPDPGLRRLARRLEWQLGDGPCRGCRRRRLSHRSHLFCGIPFHHGEFPDDFTRIRRPTTARTPSC